MSGLAALGMSSLATGLGVVVLLGIGAYAGVRKLTGGNESKILKRREFILCEVIKQTQSTISLLIQDINYITIKLNECMATHSYQDAQIKKLISLMSLMTRAGTVLTEKSDLAKNSAIKLSCAQYLDVNKLKALTSESVKADLYDFIIGFYEEQLSSDENQPDSHEDIKLVLKNNLQTKDLENLAQSLESIGYFNTSEIIKSSVSEIANKAKNKLAGFFHE